MRQIVWVSAAVKPFSTGELLRLLEHSRASNCTRGITGLLLYHDESFLQFMEGSAEEVAWVFENRIKRDRRHTDVMLLYSREVDERALPDFSMGFIDTEHLSLLSLPGFVDYRQTTSGFLHLKDDSRMLAHIINGFHDGRWHQTLRSVADE
jgi:FAD-dependent sensor of blue light